MCRSKLFFRIVLTCFDDVSWCGSDVYRDLSKPMGAQDPDRAAEYKKRYDNWLEPDPEHPTPKFHYASHYSSAAATSFYLIRLEPFTGANANNPIDAMRFGMFSSRYSGERQKL